MIKKIINKLTHSRIAKNSAWMVSETIIQMIISLVVNKIVSKYLGVSNYGIINYGISFLNFFNAICTLGLGTIAIKYLVNEKNKQGEIIGTCIFMRLISSLVSIILISSLVFVLKQGNNVIIIVSIIQSFSLLTDTFNTINWWNQYKLQSKLSVIASFIAYVSTAAFKIVLVFTKKSVIWFAFSNIIQSLIIAIVLYIIYKKQGSPKFSFSISRGKTLLKESYHFIISGLMVAIYTQTDKMMIGSMIDDMSAVGLYSVSVTIMQLWAFLPMAIIDSFKPALLEMRKNSYNKYMTKLKQLYSLIIWLSLVYTVFVFVFGKYIVLILYSGEYLECLSSLKLIIFGVLFSFVGVVREFWLVCEGKQKFAKYFALFGALANVILNLLLIPRYGITGAAIATLSTQIITALVVPLVFRDTREAVKHFICGLLFKYN